MVDLGIECISVFGLPPVQFVELAADVGCRHITTTLQPSHVREQFNPHGYPRFSLKEDKALRREMLAVMRERDVSLSLGEGLVIFEKLDVRAAYGPDLDVMRELGIERINVVSVDPDLGRSFDQLGALAEMAAAAGMETLVEFVPIFTFCDLPTALAAIRHVGRRDCRLLIDTMHFGRSGARSSDLAELDPQLIGYVQLCDAPLVPTIPDYMEEAMFQRAVPGEGELPLLDILKALPRQRIVGLEVPLRSEAEAGVEPHERMARCVEAARTLMKQLDNVA